MKSNSLIARLNTWMIRKLRISCEDTSPLISELMDHKLPLGKRLRLRFHLSMCAVCHFYQQQLQVIRSLARKLAGEGESAQQEIFLSEQAKNKIRNSLKHLN